MPERRTGLVSVFDDGGRPLPARTRSAAEEEGLAVGAINILLVNGRGEVLLQKRPEDKDNPGRWDKSVGGHVDAGESHDAAAVREAGEELFGDGRSPRVRLCADPVAFGAAVRAGEPERGAVFRRVALHPNLRDVRHEPGGGLHNVVFRVAVYLGRTELAASSFRPPPDEIAALRYWSPGEVDGMLARGELAPNMAFLWLAHARELLRLPSP
jgi:isopentenyldiphosphate isomerase